MFRPVRQTSERVEATSCASLNVTYNFFRRPRLSRQLHRRSGMAVKLSLRIRLCRVAVERESKVLVMVIFRPLLRWLEWVFPALSYRTRILKRDKKGHELAGIWAKFGVFAEICMFSQKISPSRNFLFILGTMKKLLLSLSLLAFICACDDSEAKQSTSNNAADCPQVECKCDNAEKTPEIKKESSGWKKLLVEGAKVGAGMAAGAVVANKLHCDRFDIEVEYLLLDACLNTCSGVAERDARISRCARAIQDMECSQKLSQGDIHKSVNSSCPIQ